MPALRRSPWLIVFLMTLGVVLGGIHVVSSDEDEEGAATATPAPRSSKPAASNSKSSSSSIDRKLDEILAKQETILQKFDAIMEELRIIKIRTTLGR